MSVEKIIKERYSERVYKESKPSEEDLIKVLESALHAPNSCNMQAMQFVVIDDNELKKKLGKIATGKMLWAPINILLLQDTRFTIKRYSGIMSLGASMQNMCLTATSLGLATCPMAGFENDEEVKIILGIPDHYELILILGLGYPLSSPKKRERLPLRAFVSVNKFDNSLGLKEDSSKLSDWNLSTLTDYRSRIAPVYRYQDRFSLSIYADVVYFKILDHVTRTIDNSKKVLLDLFTYDGFFIKNFLSKTNLSEIYISDSVDYLIEQNLRISDRIKSIKINKKNQIGSDDSVYDVVTFIHKAQFTPNLKDTIREVSRVLKPGGKFIVSFDVHPYKKRVVEFLRKLYIRYILRQKFNVYENNKTYKIGPRSQISYNRFKRLCLDAGLMESEYIKKTIDVGAKFKHTYIYAVFEK